MSFTIQPFLVFLGSTSSFILRRACLILCAVPPLMPPCGFSVGCEVSASFLVVQSPSFPLLPLTKDVFITCSALLPTKVPLFECGWLRRHQRRNSFVSPETYDWLYQRMRNPLCDSTFYLNITLLDKSPFLQSDPTKNSFTDFFFLTSLAKLIRQCYLFSVNESIHSGYFLYFNVIHLPRD